MQTAPPGTYSSPIDCASKLLKADGLLGFYKVSPNIRILETAALRRLAFYWRFVVKAARCVWLLNSQVRCRFEILHGRAIRVLKAIERVLLTDFCWTIGYFDTPVRYWSLRFYPIRCFRMGKKVICATGKRPRFEPWWAILQPAPYFHKSDIF